jgi:hypothetical protein
MTLQRALEAGLLVKKDGHYETGDGAFRVWYEPDRPLCWRWARANWKDDGSAGQNHGGSGTLRSCLWACAFAESGGTG